MKRILALLTALVMVLTCTAALAATAVNNGSSSSSSSDLSSVTPFKFQHMPNGIGCGTCPVYSAPYYNAYRCANGKASCATNSYIDVGGFSEQGWLLVRYSTNNGGTRVGWIPPKYVKGVYTSMSPHFTYIAQVATQKTNVSDNNLAPTDPSSIFAVLDEGETYYIVGRYNYYNYDLWYIEFYIGDQPARGFILK